MELCQNMMAGSIRLHLCNRNLSEQDFKITLSGAEIPHKSHSLNSFKTPQNDAFGFCRRTVFARLKQIVVNKLLGIINKHTFLENLGCVLVR